MPFTFLLMEMEIFLKSFNSYFSKVVAIIYVLPLNGHGENNVLVKIMTPFIEIIQMKLFEVRDSCLRCLSQ